MANSLIDVPVTSQIIDFTPDQSEFGETHRNLSQPGAIKADSTSFLSLSRKPSLYNQPDRPNNSPTTNEHRLASTMVPMSRMMDLRSTWDGCSYANQNSRHSETGA